MNYQKVHNQIINRARSENRKKLKRSDSNFIYFESNHIIPRCISGTDYKENLVLLTAREHFLIHWLLHRIYPNNYKLLSAFSYMCSLKNENRNYTISSRTYEEAMLSNYNVIECEFCHKLNNVRNHSQFHGENCKLNPNRIRKQYKPKTKIKCKYCDKIGSPANMSRWHNENCNNKNYLKKYMIKKAIYSYWEDNRKKINGGFRTQEELAICLTLSVELSLKQFEKVELITNLEGKKLLIDKYKIPFTSVRTDLEQFNYKLDPEFWAYVKIYSYSIQEEPFIHIDNDVFLFDRISDEKLSKDLLFQNKEQLSGHSGYARNISIAKKFPVIDLDVIYANVNYAYNCGVVGCNNLELIKLWKNKVDQFLFSAENQSAWAHVKDKHSNNHLFEQFFISAIIYINDLHKDVETLLEDNFLKSALVDFKMTHLWGEEKRRQDVMDRVKTRLLHDYPQYNEMYNNLKKDHSEIFTDIYKLEHWGQGKGSGAGSSPKITIEYREFLEQFFKDKNIKTIVDYGCGDWQFMKFFNFDDYLYLGIDCVKSLIDINTIDFGANNILFEFQDNVNVPAHVADVLIIKDVFIHWPNQDILNFLNDPKLKNYKYILVTNQVNEAVNNKDIATPGMYHPIHLNKNPFNLNCEEILVWKNDDKITFLITN